MSSRQIVRGSYTNYVVWQIPQEIDLNDKETYSFGDKWGTLYITNKKTGEELEIEVAEEDTFEHDQKRCDKLEIKAAEYAGEEEDPADFATRAMQFQMELMIKLQAKEITHKQGMKMLMEKFPTLVDAADIFKAEDDSDDKQKTIDVLEGDVSALTKIIADLEEENEKLKAALAKKKDDSEDEEEEYDPLSQRGRDCGGYKGCTNTLETHQECRALMCEACIATWKKIDAAK